MCVLATVCFYRKLIESFSQASLLIFLPTVTEPGREAKLPAKLPLKLLASAQHTALPGNLELAGRPLEQLSWVSITRTSS